MANGVVAGGFMTGVFRVVEAGERLLADQAQLVRLESREKLASVALRFGFAAAAVWFLLTAWMGLVVTVIVAFETVPLATRIGVATFVQLLVGLGLLAASRRAKQGDSDAK